LTHERPLGSRPKVTEDVPRGRVRVVAVAMSVGLSSQKKARPDRQAGGRTGAERVF
jgi:hypothetical protein